MPTPFEAEIHGLLRDHGDTGLVADDLLRRWNLNLLSASEQEESALFLLHAGFHTRLLSAIRNTLDAKSKVPWAILMEALGDLGVTLTEEEVKALLEGARSQDAELQLAHSRKLEKQDKVFSEIRARMLSERALQVESLRKELREKIQFMRANRLFEAEEKLLNEIQSIFPDEKEFADEKAAFELRWARDVISRSSHQATTPTVDLAWRIEKLSPEQKTSKSLIIARAKELAAEKPQQAYDIALSLHFMDFNAEALELLDEAHPPSATPEPSSSYAVDWLRLELMLHARQFLTALEEASRLELSYAGDPESAFAVVYARARALKGLGQDAMAVDLLKSLVKIRPNYKSAHSLLMDWSGGEE